MPKKLILTGLCAVLLLLAPTDLFLISADAATEVRKLEMGIKNVTLKVGQERDIYANISPAYADDKSIVWSSSDSSIVVVRDNGTSRATIEAMDEGKAKITATAHNGKTAVCNVTVSDDEVKTSRVELSQYTATVRMGQSRILFAEVFPYNADEKDVVWSSSNSEIAAVEGDGIVTGVSPGTAEITATTYNGRTAVCTVTVPSSVLTGIEQQVQSEDVPMAQVNSGEIINAAALRLDVENAAKARENAAEKRITLVYSGKSTVSMAALRSAAFTAAYNSKEAVLRFRTLDEDGGIQGQLSINPQSASQTDMDISLGVYTSGKQVQDAKAAAEKYFGKPAQAVIVAHNGGFGMAVQVAARLDAPQPDMSGMKLYRLAGGTYASDGLSDYVVDANGYIHFSATSGGTYIFA